MVGVVVGVVVGVAVAVVVGVGVGVAVAVVVGVVVVVVVVIDAKGDRMRKTRAELLEMLLACARKSQGHAERYMESKRAEESSRHRIVAGDESYNDWSLAASDSCAEFIQMSRAGREMRKIIISIDQLVSDTAEEA